jgi:hypothetical protein
MKALQAQDPRPRATTPDEAEALVAAALRMLEELEPVIATETALLRDGELMAALDLADRKAPAAQRYQRALEDLKASAVAIGRFAPPSLQVLRQRHELFEELMSLNMAVLGTAKTVSESIIRELATDVAQARSPQGYGALGRPVDRYRTPVAPLAVSKKL